MDKTSSKSNLNQSLSQLSDKLRIRSGETFTLPDLPYAYDALEPAIDTQTMKVHHDSHHATYVKKLNEALAGAEFADESLEEILMQVSAWPTSVRNNGGGHWNHSFFWKILRPVSGSQQPGPRTFAALRDAFGSYENFRRDFEDVALKRFGSGWAWLVVDPSGKLRLGSTPNQDNPLMDVSELRGIPVLGCDVWEHAYYLKHQSKRADYLKDFWSVVNWDQVERLLVRAEPSLSGSSASLH